MMRMLPYGRQHIDEDDIDAVVETLRSDFLTTGPAIQAFEEALKVPTGAANVCAVSNGTAALHLAMQALDIGPGDQVIVPSITFVASANAARFVGAEVIFADCDSDTGLLRPSDVLAALEHAPNAKALVVVHLNGLVADMAQIQQIANAHGLRTIEDSCHALGSAYHDDPAIDGNVHVGSCSYSDASAFSFHPVKIIATGEGGAVTTQSETVAARIQHLRSHGLRRGDGQLEFADAFDDAGEPLPWMYEMQETGWNYRLSDIQAALGISQLHKLPRFLQRRRELVARYDALLAPLSNVIRPVSAFARRASDRIGWHLYPVLCLGGAQERHALFNWLLERNIRPQVHYYPVHRQPYYRTKKTHRELPGADAYYARVLSLPLYYDLTEADQMRVVQAIEGFYRHHEPNNKSS